MERKVWLTSEGVRCAGALVIPDEHRPGERRAALVLCGGHGSVKQVVLPEVARHLARAGYVSLAIDYRSFGESEGEPRSQLLPAAQVDDVRNAISFLQQQPEVDPDRIGLWGVHLGGGVALQACATDRRVRCVVAQSPVANGRRWMRSLRSPSRWEQLLDRLQRDRINRSRSGYSEYVTAFAVDGPCAMPADDRGVAWIDACYAATPTLRRQITLRSAEAIAEWCPEAHLSEIAPRPACIVALDRDTLVPGEEAARAFERLSEPRRLVWLTEETAGHHTQLLSGSGLGTALSVAVDFLSEHLPALPRGIAEAAAAAEPGPLPEPGAAQGEAPAGSGDAMQAPSDASAQPAAGDAPDAAAAESAAAAEPEPQPQAAAAEGEAPAEPGDAMQAPSDASAQPAADDAPDTAAGESAAAAEPEPQPEPDAAQGEAAAEPGDAMQAPSDAAAQPAAGDAADAAAGESAAAAEPEPQPEAAARAETDAAAGETAAASEPEPETEPAPADATAEPEPAPAGGDAAPAGDAGAAAESAAAAERMPMAEPAAATLEAGAEESPGVPEPEPAAAPEDGTPQMEPAEGMEARESPQAPAAETEPATPAGGQAYGWTGGVPTQPQQPPAEHRPWWDRPPSTNG